MSDAPLHSWNVTPKEAVCIQESLAGRIDLAWDGRSVSTVAGIDVSVKGGVSRAAIVLLTFPDLAPLESTVAERPTPFPYVPGLLTFREGPVVLDAWANLKQTPDVVLFDGQGIAHPRRMGLAAHLGLWLGIPAIGCAKSRLYGRHGEPGPRKGDAEPLVDERDPSVVIGSVLRSRENVKPLFVSPGHRMGIRSAVSWALRCGAGYRVPEPTRRAHHLVNELRIQHT